MKKLLLLVASLILGLTACQKDEGIITPEGELQTITVKLPELLLTKATTADFGNGANVNRCIMQIYRNGAVYGERQVAELKTVDGTKTATFQMRLVSSQTYDFVFWSDYATGTTAADFADAHYNTSDLTNITLIAPYSGNNDEFDAFSGAILDYKVTGQFNKEVVLTRPFGQLNVKTLDWAAIKDAALQPAKVKVNFTALPTSFNAKSGEVGSQTSAIEYTADVLCKGEASPNGELTVDYIFAPETESSLSDFTMTFLDEAGAVITTNDSFTNIPVRRNYRTNVKGNLLTKQGEIKVTVDAEFATPDYDKEIVEVATVNEVAQAIKEGARNIVIKSEPEADAVIEIPHTLTQDEAAEKVTITLPATDKNITIKYTDEKNGEATKEIELFVTTTGTLVLDLPSSTVILRGDVGSLEVTTAENTLVVPEGITVGSMKVNGGNVEIYGDVKAIEFANDESLISVYGVKSVDKLKEAVGYVEDGRCAKILLAADLDLAGSEDNLWKPIDTEGKKFVEFDGAGHTISNLYVDNYDKVTTGGAKGHYYGGFFYVLQGAVKNLTIKNANVISHRGGVLVGRMDYGTVENCHIKGATVQSIQKVAGLVGFVNTSNKDVTIKGSSVDALSVSTPLTDNGLYQTGGLIGYIHTLGTSSLLIEGNSVSNITLNNVYAPGEDVKDKVHALEQIYSHSFIGTISNVSKREDAHTYKVELKNNKVDKQQIGIPTCDRTDDYIGWWAGEYNVKGSDHAYSVVVDGVEKDRWIELKRLYNLLQAGGEVTVYRNYDLTKCQDTKGDIIIGKPTVVEIQQGATLTVGNAQLTNQSELTIQGEGTLAGVSNLIYNEKGAKVTIESGNYKASGTGDAAIVFNQGDVVVDGGQLETNGHFAIQNNYGQSVTINGGSITAKGTKDYCILMHGSGHFTVTGGTITGNFGCVRLHGGTTADISGGEFIGTGRYYALYVGASGKGVVANVSGGKFRSASTSSPNICVYVDANSKLNLTGGEFQNKGYDAKVSGAIVPQEGYQFVDNADENYKFKVVSM